MKNKKFLLGMSVFTLMFGMAVVGVEAQSNKGGVFTLTDIPAQYNGKYAFLIVGQGDVVGCESMDAQKGTVKASRIRDGKVIIPMWTSLDGKSVVRYTGNNSSVRIEIRIVEKEIIILEKEFDNILQGLRFGGVNFSNGNATKSYDSDDEMFRR